MAKRDRMFPIQRYYDPHSGRDLPAGEVPWGIAQIAYKTYREKHGDSQSLKRLAERGGFGWLELVWLLQGGQKDQFPVLPWADGRSPGIEMIDNLAGNCSAKTDS